jgi:hypothetical protein
MNINLRVSIWKDGEHDQMLNWQEPINLVDCTSDEVMKGILPFMVEQLLRLMVAREKRIKK